MRAWRRSSTRWTTSGSVRTYGSRHRRRHHGRSRRSRERRRQCYSPACCVHVVKRDGFEHPKPDDRGVGRDGSASARSKLTGETKTEAVTRALQERLERIRRERMGRDLAERELDEIALHCVVHQLCRSSMAGQPRKFSATAKLRSRQRGVHPLFSHNPLGRARWDRGGRFTLTYEVAATPRRQRLHADHGPDHACGRGAEHANGRSASHRARPL